MVIEIYKTFKSEKITDYAAGARLFNIFKENVEKNPEDMQLELDFKDVKVFTQVPFKTLVSSMKSRLNGDYQIKLVNQNPLIEKSFANSLK